MTVIDHRGATAAFDQSFSGTASRKGTLDQWLRIAGHPVVVRYAGTRMRDAFARSFTHLQAAKADDASLTISVWAGTEPGGRPPLPLIPPEAEHGDRAIFRSEALRLVYHIGPGMLTALAPGAGQAWVWIADVTDLPFWEKAAPFGVVWRWWLAEVGHTVLHAGTVATGAGGVLLVGSGGSGKSTASIACLEDGFRYAGDDYVVLDPDGSTIHSLYGTGKLEHEHLDRVTNPRGDSVPNPDVPKRVLMLADSHPDLVVPSLSVHAVLAPRLRPQRQQTTFRPISSAEAIRATAPSSMIQLPDGKQRDLAAIAGLVRALPAYSLELGSDVSTIPGAVRRLLREVDGG